MLTSSCNGGWLVDRKVFLHCEVDLGVYDVIVIKFLSVKDMSFWNDFPKVLSSVFDVADVSFIELISIGAPGVTPPDEGWKWGWDRRCHGESLGVSESLS